MTYLAASNNYVPCPRCKQRVPSLPLFEKDGLSMRRGVAVCPHCGFRFRYGTTGFRVFAGGFGVAILCSAILVLLELADLASYENLVFNVVAGAILTALCGILFAGYEEAPQNP